jgi:hypothetical protein
MRHRVDAELRAEAARYALVFGCRRCAHFEEGPASCSLGFPTDEHLDVDLAASGEVVFCKTFELG